MITEEQVRSVIEKIKSAPSYSPYNVVLGITKYPLSPDGEPAVMMYFTNDKPKKSNLVDRIDGVKIVYRFGVGEMRLLSATT